MNIKEKRIELKKDIGAKLYNQLNQEQIDFIATTHGSIDLGEGGRERMLGYLAEAKGVPVEEYLERNGFNPRYRREYEPVLFYKLREFFYMLKLKFGIRK